jgi:hypothetical protein
MDGVRLYPSVTAAAGKDAMRLRRMMRRVRRLMCMAGMHQFTDEQARCIAPGCRAPNEGWRAGAIARDVRAAGVGDASLAHRDRAGDSTGSPRAMAPPERVEAVGAGKT